MENIYCTITYNYEDVPLFEREKMTEWFMNNRSGAVDIYTKYIGQINREWDKTGKLTAFGEYLEDINPEYTSFIKSKLQPFLDDYNKKFKLYKFDIDEYGDLVGRIVGKKKSKLFITFKEIEL